MRLYIAGASKEPKRVRAAMNAAIAAGMTITLDWLTVIETVGTANDGLTDYARQAYAAEDLDGVRHADVLWLLASEGSGRGAWVEYGYALGCGVHTTVVSGTASKRSIFSALADAELDTDEEALAWLVAHKAAIEALR